MDLTKILGLKVGSCPNDDNFVNIFFFILFCVVFKYFYFVNLFLPRKILLRSCVCSFVYFLCVGIPILKKVLSETHKKVTSDVNL